MRRFLFLVAAIALTLPLFIGQGSPDLTVDAIDVSAVTTDTQTLAVSGTITPTIRNLGGAISTPFLVRVFEDRNGNGTYEASDLSLGTSQIASLGAGSIATPSISLSGTLLFAGNILYVTADANNQIVESNETNNTRHSGQAFTFVPGEGGLNPTLLWERRSFTQAPSSYRAGPLTVGDLDGDGFPEIVFTTFFTNENIDGRLRVLDGRDGSEKFTIMDPAYDLSPLSSQALADLDGDGRPEIVALDEQCRLLVFNHDGTFKWRGDQREGLGVLHRCIGGPSVADLNRDGIPEVIIGRSAYSNTGVRLWTGTGRIGGGLGPLSIPANIDGVGDLEVVAGSTVYNSAGQTVFDYSGITVEGYAGLANLDSDPEAEIIIKPRVSFNLHVLEHNGVEKYRINWPDIGGGPPVIGNFDSDPEPEFAVETQNEFRVFEADGTLKWSKAIFDQSSGFTGATLFDFDNDGSVEVVFGDEQFLYIWRGSDGLELFKAPRRHGTGIETPIVADVNGDGHADIVVPYGTSTPADPQGIAVYSGAALNWAKTRPLWNQASYSINNINDDFSVPQFLTPNWLVPGFNNFRVNAFLPGQGSGASALGDYTISFLRRDDTDFPLKTRLIARIGNGGGASLFPIPVRLTDGAGGPVLCTAQTATILQPGQYQDVSCDVLNPVPGSRNVVATVDPDNTIREGLETNNTAGAVLTIGLGPLTTVSELTVRARDAAMDVRWNPIPGAVSYNIYRKSGNGTYSLHRAAYVNALGAFADTQLTNNTVYWYEVRWLNSAGVESPQGTEASAMPIPRSQRGDTAPTITSRPVTRASTGALYQYRLAASDPDLGDILTYELSNPPSGMSIHAQTGQISWTPTLAQAGAHRILASVRDIRNRVTSQHFTVFVDSQLSNAPPVITSSPISSAIVGRNYSYTVRASDPDSGDLVTYQLANGPAGMSINPNTGLLSWLPGVAQTGMHPVSVSARDLLGYTATQNFNIQVTNPNRQPIITSNAPAAGLLGTTYSYSAQASDPDAGDILFWTLLAGPAEANLNNATGLLLFNAPAVGSFAFTIQVSDQLGASATQSFTVNIGVTANENPVFTSSPNTSAEADAPYVYQATAQDPDGDQLIFTLVSGPTGMTVSPAGLVQWQVPTNATGSQPVTLRVTDPFNGSAQQSFNIVFEPADTTPPTVIITSPSDNATITGEVTVTGTVNDVNLREWYLEYQVAGATDWVRLNGGTTNVNNGVLGAFPGALLANNPYKLRVSAFDRRQGFQFEQFVQLSGSPVKLGAFTLDYIDLRIPGTPLPIEIKRHYDSRKPYWNDFGSGWALGFSEIDLRVDSSYNAHLTLPSGREVVFLFQPIQPSPVFPTLENRYNGPTGTADKLENLDCPDFLGTGASFVCLSGDTPFQPYEPKRWLLTTREGTKLTINQSRVTRVEDPSGNWTEITPAGITSSSGRSVAFTRDSAGRITQFADQKGNRHLYSYDSLGRLVTHADPLSRQTQYEYAGQTHLVSRILAPGACEAIRQEFDLTGRLTARVDAQGRRTEYAYNLATRTETKTLPGGITTIETFDPNGNPVSFTDGEGQLWSFAYDAANNRNLTVFPSGRRIARTHDAAGNVLTEEDGPLGGPARTTSYQWTAANLLARISRPNGDYQLLNYDANGNLLSTQTYDSTNTLAESQTFGYDALGRLTSEQSPRGIFQYSYDSAGNLTRITDGALRVENFTYDATGNIGTAFNGLGQRYESTYDGNGLPANTVIEGALFRTQSWNEFSLPASVGNALGQNFVFGYSCSGELTQVTDPAGGQTQYDRGGLGRITQMRDALTRATNYAHNGNGLPTLNTSPAGDTLTRTYNADGQITSWNAGLGAVTTTYDAFGQIATEATPTRSEAYTRDARGRVTTITSTGQHPGVMTLAYTPANRTQSVTDRFNQTVTYTYDSLGRRASLLAPDGSLTTYTYDAGGKIQRITTGTDWAEYSYDSSGRRVGLLYSNGVRAAYTWDLKLRPASITWYTPANNVIRSWAYTYDAAGRRTSATLNDGSIQWTYDALGRLTSETIVSSQWGNRSGSWTYDAVGNRLDTNATYGLDHRQLTFAAENLTHDAAGNQRNSGAWTLNYDERRRLIGILGTAYRYNGLGLRDQVGTSTNYIYDGDNILHMLSSGTIVHRFTFGIETDEILFSHTGSSSRFYITDEQGSVFALTDDTGAVVLSYAYDAWGTRYFQPGAFNMSLGEVNYNPFEFQAKEFIFSANLYNFRERAYRPAQGRFMQKDPAPGSSFLPASRHPYQFAFNQPTQYVDPDGRSAIQYGILVKANKIVEAIGYFISFMNTFGGTNLAFLGNFIENRVQYPNQSISASAQSALASATKSIETVVEEFEKKTEESDASIADGLNGGGGYGIQAAGYWINYAVLGIPPF